MRKTLILLLIITLCLSLLACGQSGGKTDKVIIDYGTSAKFSENELESAAQCILNKFKSFKGCELTNLRYDEDASNSHIQSYMSNGKGSANGVLDSNVVVFFSDFTVDASGGDGSLNPNSTYTGWNWILVRDSKAGMWRVDDWGY